MNKIQFAFLALLSISVLPYNVTAKNITTFDGSGLCSNGTCEDNETEPGTVQTQNWDLEGMLLNGSKLTLVGGYNFQNGYDNIKGGDIFINTIGSINYLNSGYGNYNEIMNSFGFDFVVDITDNSYTILALNQDSKVKTGKYTQNYLSGPFEYVSGMTKSIGSGEVVYGTLATNDFDNSWGGVIGTHYTLTIDLLSLFETLPYNQQFTASYTMGCGNDHLVGQGNNPVPEPATMLLFGSGLVGFAGITRRRMRS